ncbi:MAG: hypothetical protein II781_00920 [Clostridia bacterium]|nr:hypothetical protein [Clostridia bacterium]
MKKKTVLLILLALCLCLISCGENRYDLNPDATSPVEVMPDGNTRYTVTGLYGTISLVPPRSWKTTLCPSGTEGSQIVFGFTLVPPEEEGGFLAVGIGSMYFCGNGLKEDNLTVAGVPANIISSHEYEKGKGWRYLSIGIGNFMKAEYVPTSRTLPFWSRETSNQALEMLDTLTFVPSADAPPSCQNIPYTKEEAQKILAKSLSESSLVIEGTLVSHEEQPRDPDMEPGYYDVYTFEDLNVITGVYEKSSLTLRVFRGLIEHKWNDYDLGCRYIIPIRKIDSVFRPEETVELYNPGFVCRVQKKDPEKIEELNLQGFPMESMMGTRGELIDFIREKMGIQPSYFQEYERYVHSDNIGDIVRGSPIVARILTDPDNAGVVSHDYYSETFFCRVCNVYKGTLPVDSDTLIKIRFRQDTVTAGEEYLVCLDKDMWQVEGEYRYQINAKENAVIPVSDPAKSQQVYSALGLEPDQTSPLFASDEEKSAVERDTDTENVEKLYGRVDFAHLLRVYELGKYGPSDFSLKEGLLFQEEYAAPILGKDNTILGLAHLGRISPNGKYIVTRFFPRLDFMDQFYSHALDPDAEMYYVHSDVLWDVAILVEMETREKYISLLKKETRDIYGLEILNQIRDLSV